MRENFAEDAIKAQAEQRMLAGKADPVEKFPQGTKSRDKLGAMAGVSGKTYEHATAVLDNAPTPVVEATRKKKLSINAAYEVTKLPEEKQTEISERIEQGEKPREVVADVKKKKNELINMNYWNALIGNAEKVAKTGHNIDAIINIMNRALSILNNATNIGQ